MQISWLGLSCFEITTSTANGEVTVVTDPYGNETGLRFPRTVEANIACVSHDDADANNLSAIGGEPFVVKMAGEYEVKDVFVYAIPVDKGIVFRIEAEGMHVAHLGAINRALSDKELETLGTVDILMIPVGGGRVLSPKLASEVIAQIEPRVVIPMTHGIAGVKETLATADDFCKAIGTCRRETGNKYKISKKDLPADEMLIMELAKA
jgi:L-ascorbate metabolism protein UlaG (beta-lactamase superfamily)